MHEPIITLRRARTGELALLVSIDEDAGKLYAEAGIVFDTPADHPHALAEHARWQASIDAGQTWLALDADGEPVGFAVLARIDGEPHLEQLAVRKASMGRGVGTRLVREAIAWSAPGPLWLSTYAHVPWNRPYYERLGFRVVAESDCGPALRAALAAERAVLPFPDQRVAMRRD